jgi:actin cytoskeleton-regulatory complex protein PAN1
MYSNPNSFLGGNSLRPSQPQYGNQYGAPGGQQPQAQQQQQQPSPFAPQPTGYGQAPPIQQQYTGFPGLQPPAPGPGSLQQQYTGFGQPAPQSGFQSAAPPMPSIPAQFQQQFQQQQQQQQQPPQQASTFASAPPAQASAQALAPPPAPMKPQPTGFSEMAASFQTGGTAKPKGRRAEKTTTKIPNIRLSFISAQDQAKFESVFKSAVGETGQTTMSGEKARDLLLRSRLDGDSLSHIWFVVLFFRGFDNRC